MLFFFFSFLSVAIHRSELRKISSLPTLHIPHALCKRACKSARNVIIRLFVSVKKRENPPYDLQCGFVIHLKNVVAVYFFEVMLQTLAIENIRLVKNNLVWNNMAVANLSLCLFCSTDENSTRVSKYLNGSKQHSKWKVDGCQLQSPFSALWNQEIRSTVYYLSCSVDVFILI